MEYYSAIKRNQLLINNNFTSLNGSILEKAVFWKRQNYRNVKLTNSCQEPGVRKGFDDKGAASPPWPPGVMELISVLIVVVISQIYK